VRKAALFRGVRTLSNRVGTARVIISLRGYTVERAPLPTLQLRG